MRFQSRHRIASLVAMVLTLGFSSPVAGQQDPPALNKSPLMQPAARGVVLTTNAMTADALKFERKLRAKAAQLAEVAGKIRINGRDGDWQGIPSFSDSHEDDCRDRTRDLVGTAIAPLSDRILIILDTRGKPSNEPGAFWVDVDVMGSHTPDFQIGFTPQDKNTFLIFEDGKLVTRTTIEGIKYKISSHLTAEIPIASVQNAYRAADREFPADALARGWVRVTPYTLELNKRTDRGAAAASPVLDRSEFFDSPIAAVADKSKWGRRIPMPLRGKKWYVGQGAMGAWTHQSVNAYDLYLVDATMEPATQPMAKLNPEYYCWGEDIIAPVKSRVVRTQKDTIDNLPFDATRREANKVYLDIGGNMALQLLHCQQNSVTVKAGEMVEAGTVVGQVGNSGSYAFAHLHFDLWKLPNGSESIPAAFEDVRVSLNAVSDCPWTRAFSTWVVDEGWFVEAGTGKLSPDVRPVKAIEASKRP